MTNSSQSHMTCFFSMTFGHRVVNWVYEITREVARNYGLEVVRADMEKEETVSRDLREKVRAMIDKAILVIAETSGFSWYVAFELFHAIEKKHCIVLMLDEDLPGMKIDRSVRNVFPEKSILHYKLPLPHDNNEKAFRTRLDKAFQDALNLSDNWRSAITAQFFSRSGRRIPSDLINPRVKINSKEQEPNVEEEFFTIWEKGKKQPERIAIIGAQGSGKTVLLSRFADWLARPSHQKPLHVHNLLPIGIFMTASDIPDEFSAQNFWATISGLVHRSEASCRTKSHTEQALIHPGLLEPYRQAGLVFLLFDGIDELGTRRPGEESKLMEAFEELTETGVNVILTCRRNYWLY